MIINTVDNQFNFLNFRISSSYQKWSELKHVLIDRRIKMTARTKSFETCVSSRLLYSVQAWDLYACELRITWSIWHNFLRNMVAQSCSLRIFGTDVFQIRT